MHCKDVDIKMLSVSQQPYPVAARIPRCLYKEAFVHKPKRNEELGKALRVAFA
jgi:hypothetical protein